ncbi:Zinc finger PHD-type protein [Lasiodiplodia theobromae]|uniref:JmjC domain-containing histone demethylation protein 1 n=1 Tax=Lasiodiplodia theobromae TaxID=45133 RepID=A0A8H7MCJ8_9PEZI|nr:Zinc finger PHD-type protein [Lasiodiplodia theobromae]
MKLSSFKQPVSDAPLPPRTPSPILRFVEPLTPTCPTAYKDGPLFPNSSASGLVEALQNYGWSVSNAHTGKRASSEKVPSVSVKAERAAQSSRQTNGHGSRSSSHGSPIDALADIASSMAPSPLLATPAAFPHSQPSPRTSARPTGSSSRHSHAASDGHNYRYNQGYTYGYDHGYGCDERPSKRARSEVALSEQYNQTTARPFTSHTQAPAVEPPYSVEQGRSLFPEQAAYPSFPTNNDEMDIAQVLLGLRNGSIDNGRGARRSIAAPQAHYSQTGLSAWYEMPTQAYRPGETQYQGFSENQYRPRPHANSFSAPRPEPLLNGSEMNEAKFGPSSSSAVQTHTPPDETYDPSTAHAIRDDPVEHKKGKGNQGWPKGKPRGPRKSTAGKKSKAAAAANDGMLVPVREGGSDQLQSPQSLPGEPAEPPALENKPTIAHPRVATYDISQARSDVETARRRSSFGMYSPPSAEEDKVDLGRASSVPAETSMTIRPALNSGKLQPAAPEEEVTICAGCHFSRGPSTGQKDQWIGCNGCQNWYHFACAGFKNAKEVSSVDKYFCRTCRPKYGPTTFVRKSKRAQAGVRVDYAGLNEGVFRTSEDEYEHHYIQLIKDGAFNFQPETFPRMRPELVTAENFEKSGGFREPIVIPACWNTRPSFPGAQATTTHVSTDSQQQAGPSDDFYEDVEYETVANEGQDSLDMVIPQGLTVRRVAELYGPEEKVEVIDVKSQEGEDRRWNMSKWADYYEEEGEKPVRNVISLEISHSKLGRLIRRPKVVRELDLQDAVWPEEETARGVFPKVQFYCLMSVADCYTDFHIDFGGSSVYYHIIKGKKTFFFIPPKKQHLKKYEDWCLSQAQNWTFLADETKECYRVDLSEGDTMLIPSGWIHAVWTPENSLVIGGNFLTRLNYGMQIRVAEIEKNTKVARKFRYPHFQKVHWYTVLQYLHRDPLPQSVMQLFYEGKQFSRETPIWMEPNKFGHNSDLGPENYNARYYSRSELDGLPDLVSYIFRTVMISQGRVEGITAEVRNAVTKSIPKTAGDPLEIIKTFAMWVAWKRGNEDIPQWAHPDAILPEVGESGGEKKLSAAALKRMERKAFIDAFRLPERVSARQQKKAQDAEAEGTVAGSPSSQPVKHTSTPKTSVLGPKRIACDACRRRRIRCKHKDEVSAPNATTPSKLGERRESAQMVAVVIPSSANGMHMNGSPRVDPQLTAALATTFDGQAQQETPDGKRGRSKACLDCRKSKRRCIHDEHGNIDPIKAQEAPIPRGTQSSKKRRVSGAGDEADTIKKPKKESRPSISLPSGVSLFDHDVMPNGQHQQGTEPQAQGAMEVVDDVHMSDAPPVQPVADIVPESYPTNIETIEEAVDQVMTNGIDHVEPSPKQATVEPTPASDIALPTTESVPEHAVSAEHQHSTIRQSPPPPKSGQANGVEPSSPLTDLANSASPEHTRQRHEVQPVPVSPSERRHSSRASRPVDRYSTVSSTGGGRNSQPPSASKGRPKSRTPGSIVGAKQDSAVTPTQRRRASNASVEMNAMGSGGKRSVKSEDVESSKQRAMSVSQAGLPEEDEASLRLIREIMGEERGLRRRGSR